MGLCVHRNGRIGSEFDECLYHIVRARILDASGQLAVGEGAGAALAEHDIARGIELARTEEGIDVLFPFGNCAAAFEHDNLIASLCKLI